MNASSGPSESIHQSIDLFTNRSMYEWLRYVKATGLSMPLFGILMHLYYRNSCSVSQISEYLSISAASASQLVDRLVQNGMVERTEEPKNRRAKRLTLTSQGRDLIQAGINTRHTWVDSLMDRMSLQESRQVAEGLDILTHYLQRIQTEK
jgi:DNA-binding MarR family transcriptional regulator